MSAQETRQREDLTLQGMIQYRIHHDIVPTQSLIFRSDQIQNGQES